MEWTTVDRSIERTRRTRVVGPKRGPDLVEMLRDLAIVFRAESGIPCRVTLDVAHAFCDSALGTLINRGMGLLLQQVSKRAVATLVALSIGKGSDESIVIRVDVDEPHGARAEEPPPAVRARVTRMRALLLELGVRLETDAHASSALLVVPSALVSVD
jgi:hypothetical protein